MWHASATASTIVEKVLAEARGSFKLVEDEQFGGFRITQGPPLERMSTRKCSGMRPTSPVDPSDEHDLEVSTLVEDSRRFRVIASR